MDQVSAIVSGLEFKVRKLIDRQKSLKKENQKLTEELERFKSTCEEQKNTIREFEDKIRVLKMARVSGEKADNEDIRLRINELIREIDKSIGLLNT
jgi:predicted nuclease with TOPRIM domain